MLVASWMSATLQPERKAVRRWRSSSSDAKAAGELLLAGGIDRFDRRLGVESEAGVAGLEAAQPSEGSP